jgi:two-component system cell cycle response regulator DivK
MGRVAIVDDSKDTLELFEVILRDHHEFRTFPSGIELLKDFHRGDFDLILLDLVMPELDGFDTFRRIREVDKNVPVVAVSAAAFANERETALSAGFCDYFIKPIMEIQKFREAIYSHIGKCRNPPREPSDESAA